MEIVHNFARPIEALQSCFDLEYLLIGDLRQLLSESQPAQTSRSLLAILDPLLANLPQQMKLSCASGYVYVVLEECPNLHRQIEALKNANTECIEALRVLRNLVADQRPFAAIAHEVSCKLVQWMKALAAIRMRESHLLQEALTLDVGGEA